MVVDRKKKKSQNEFEVIFHQLSLKYEKFSPLLIFQTYCKFEINSGGEKSANDYMDRDSYT